MENNHGFEVLDCSDVMFIELLKLERSVLKECDITIVLANTIPYSFVAAF